MTTPLPQRRCQLENQFSWSKAVFLHDFMTSPSMKSWSFWAKNEQIALPTRRSRRSRWAWAGPWQRTKWKTVDLKVISASPTKKSLDFESDLPEGLPSSLYTFLPSHAMETPIDNEDILLSRHATKICRCPCPGLTTPAEDFQPTPHYPRILQLCSWFLKVEREHMRGGGPSS